MRNVYSLDMTSSVPSQYSRVEERFAGSFVEMVTDSKKESGYDIAVGPCRFFLRLFGVWPDPFVENNALEYLRAIIVSSTMVFFATITQTAKNLQVWGDLNVVTEISINSQVPTSTAAVKVAGIWYHRRALRKLMIQIANDWRSPHDPIELQIMEENARFSRLVSATCIFLADATFVIQCVIAVLRIDAQNRLEVNGTVVYRPLYMRASFPYDSQISPNYELTLAGQLFSNFFAATTYTSIDSLFVVLMLHLCGQLSVLRLAFLELKGCSRKEFVERIAYIHRRHNHLTVFANTIEEVFNKTFLLQIITSSFVLCMLGYQIITITNGNNIPFMELIFMIYYVICFMFITFTYCYMAEQLREKSVDISDAAYQCDWYELTPQQSKQLIIIMLRARRPFQITAGKFVAFSLSLYCSILRSSGGYMSMLLAIQQRLGTS